MQIYIHIYIGMIKNKNNRFKNLACMDGKVLNQNHKNVLNVFYDYVEAVINDGDVLYGTRNIGGGVIHSMLGYIEVYLYVCEYLHVYI
jgi:hypothetical protein